MVARTQHAQSKLLAGSLIEEQIERELDAVRMGVERYADLRSKAINRHEGAMLKPVERLLVHWLDATIEAIEGEKKLAKRGANGPGYGVSNPMMFDVDAPRMAVIAMHETFNALLKEPAGVVFGKIGYAIGRAVVAEMLHDRLRKGHSASLDELDKRFRRLTAQRVNWWAKTRHSLDDPKWGIVARGQLGTRLLWCFLTSATFVDGDQVSLAFKLEHTIFRGKPKRVIRMAERTLEVIEEGDRARSTMRPRYLPMVVAPLPWLETESGAEQGGYLKIRTPLIAKPTPSQKRAIEKADKTRLFRGLDALVATPWTINTRVAAVQEEFWERGGGVMGIPSRDNVVKPPRPDTDDEDAIKAWKRTAHGVYRENIHRAGARKQYAEMLGVAKRFSRFDAIYFPHQLDFRGRAYPIPAHLNHQGDDTHRGLLRFAKPVPLSPIGWKWLRVHAANCYGIKGTFAERERWTEEHMREIERSAENPMREEFWRRADESEPGKWDGSPWQFLAACFALTNDEDAARLPVQWDGTCNGLQHYAAMTRDRDAARLVNLLPGDRPEDIYAATLEAIRPRVMADAAAGVDEAKAIIRYLGRGLVKQPVMTSVYGVTRRGARGQIDKKATKLGMTKEGRWHASMYMAGVTLGGLSEVQAGAVAAMKYIRECARRAVETGEALEWTSPIGLPIVQPYRKRRIMEIETIGGRISLPCDDEVLPIAKKDQIDGSAPNFVHGVDASHMYLTADRCRNDLFIDMAAVHDSYWCHAEHTPLLMEAVRETMIEVHRRPLLEDLHEQLVARYPGVEFDAPPETGDFDLNDIADATYAFS